MPQPYPKNLTPNFSIGETAKTHPLLSLSGMHVITQYSQLEIFLANVLTSLLGANPKPAVAILAAIKNSNVRNDALRSVAEEVLTPDRLELLNSVLKVVDAADKERNRIAHWLWASDPSLGADAVALIDPRKMASLTSDSATVMATGTVDHAKAVAMQEKMRDMASVYRSTDFDNAFAAVNRASVLLSALSILLQHADGTPEADNARQLILHGPKVGLRQGQPNAGPAIPSEVQSTRTVHS